MKGTILALASILVVVAGMTLVAPVSQVVAVEEATACPGDVCLIYPHGGGSVEGDKMRTCGADCDTCCNYCAGYTIVGNPNCDCTVAGTHRRCPH